MYISRSNHSIWILNLMPAPILCRLHNTAGRFTIKPLKCSRKIGIIAISDLCRNMIGAASPRFQQMLRNIHSFIHDILAYRDSRFPFEDAIHIDRVDIMAFRY